MRLLLDTHVLIWRLGGDDLSPEADLAIQRAETVVASATSVWEAEIKAASGKLDLRGDLRYGIEVSGLTPLPITLEHAIEAARLPRHHGDPFDRMLIAQARIERLTLVTRDARFAAYDVDLLPA